MDEAVWRTVTDFGDSAVTLPLVLAVAACLAGGGEARAAARLLLPVALCGAMVGGSSCCSARAAGRSPGGPRPARAAMSR